MITLIVLISFYLEGILGNIIHTNYLDNPFLPKEYVDTLLLMKNTNEVYYKIYALGEFGSLDKLVYNNW